MSQLKKLKNGDKRRCRVPRTCTPRVGTATGTVELFRSPSRAIRAYGEAPCHLERRTERECTGPFLVEAGGRGLGPAAKEDRAPGILSGTQDILWEPEVTSVCRVRSSQQLLRPQGSKSYNIVGNVCQEGDSHNSQQGDEEARGTGA